MKCLQMVAAISLLSSALPTASADAGRLGIMADVGVPDGANASLVVRPVSIVKLHAGLGYNLIAPGVRVGASVTPLPWFVSPSLSVEAGHYFRGDANPVVNQLGSRPPDEPSDSPVLREVGYQYANLHVGLDFGGKRMTVYLHAGMSGIRGTIRNLNEELNSEGDMDGPTIEFREDPIVTLFVPSARTGIIVFF